jgi:hypothetical protein
MATEEPTDRTGTESPADPDGADADLGRPEQHGPEMDDTQVAATGELADELDPVTDDEGED